MAGHSKWANIKHRKGAQDAARAKLFAKFAKEIMVAAAKGGPDLSSNASLRLAVSKAKAKSMPKANIENAIAKEVSDRQTAISNELSARLEAIANEQTARASEDAKLQQQINANKAEVDQLVVDSLTSSDKTKALSANQGRVLNDKFKNYYTKTEVDQLVVDTQAIFYGDSVPVN